MNFYDGLRKTMVKLAQVEGDAEIVSILVRAGKHYYCINTECEAEELDVTLNEDKSKGFEK